tara:strand:- start:780 stop:1211 length:432 start_codon:yes stop_codon:yes gene_type:complete
MNQLTFDLLDIICQNIVQQGSLFYNLISSCKSLHEFGKYRKQNNENKCILDILKNDNIEQIAILVDKDRNADDVLKLALIHGSQKIAWWIWSQHRPFMTIQILMDVQRNMFVNESFNCNDFTHRVLKSIQCTHEAAHKRSLFL